MIPRFLRPEVFPYASVEVIPAPSSPTAWWVRLRFKKTGAEVTYTEKSALNRGLLITVTRLYADVIDQGER